jgi:hypothetical protein
MNTRLLTRSRLSGPSMEAALEVLRRWSDRPRIAMTRGFIAAW